MIATFRVGRARVRGGSARGLALALLLVCPTARAAPSELPANELVRGKEPSAPAAAGKHCLESATARWISEQTLVAQVAPEGAELEAKAGACWPLIPNQGELFDYTHLVLGLDAQVTAGYVQVGPYVEILPLSVLGFRAELHGVHYFPAGFSGAGYFARESYVASVRLEDLPADEAGSATGFNWVVAAWLQLELELGDPVSLFVWSEAAVEHWSLGEGPYYYNARWDLILKANDELLRNDAYAGASVQLTPALDLGIGPTSALRRVPDADYTAHQLGGALNLGWQPRSGALRSLDTFVAVGGYLKHSFRQGAFVSLALTAGWDLGPL